jgi:hypothetical protein
MILRRIGTFLSLAVLSISHWASAMPIVHFDVEVVNGKGRRPVCWYQTETGEE